MTLLNRIFLVTSLAIAIVDVALAAKTSVPGMFIGSLGLALLAVVLLLRQHRTT